MGFEPTTTCLGSKDSTTELRPLAVVHPTRATIPSQERPPYLARSTRANLRRPIFIWYWRPASSVTIVLASLCFF